MLMIAGMHLLGLVCVAVLIIPALREGPGAPPRNDSGSDDGGGWGPKAPPKPPAPPAGASRFRTPCRRPSVCAITDASPITTHRASAGRRASRRGHRSGPENSGWPRLEALRAVALAGDPLAHGEQLNVQPRDRVPRPPDSHALDDR